MDSTGVHKPSTGATILKDCTGGTRAIEVTPACSVWNDIFENGLESLDLHSQPLDGC